MPNERRYAAFTPAQRFAASLHLLSRAAWRKWAATNRAILEQKRIPIRPDAVYRTLHVQGALDGARTDDYGNDWRGWHHWLGIQRTLTDVMPFGDWQRFILDNNIKSKTEYQRWLKTHSQDRRTLKLPASPDYAYKDFSSWRTLFGHASYSRGNIAREYAPFRDVRHWVRSLNISKFAAWRASLAEPNFRAELAARRCPVNPDRVAQYRENWRGWKDFLGSDTRPTQNYKR